MSQRIPGEQDEAAYTGADAPLLTDDFKEFLRLFNAHHVGYLVVGDYAVGVHGYPLEFEVTTPPKRPRVLLADDYPEMVAAIAQLLAADYDVVGSVADGSALLEAAARLQPDVIVLDLNMPNVNGLEACRQITQAIPAIKVIVLTALIDAVIMQKALESGASAFIAKQAIADELQSAIKCLCDKA